MTNALRCLALLITAGGADAVARDAPAVTIPATYQHDLRAGTDGPGYRLFVALPPGYDPGGSDRYPTLFVLDGNVVFPFATMTQQMFGLFGETPNLIVVGIGYPVRFFPETVASRWHDLTPSRKPDIDSAQSVQFGVELRSGGAAKFLRFLRDDAIPFVDAAYRTNGDRAVLGHSLGGLFALYTLFESPDLFQRYGISSPSLQFSGEDMFTREAAYAERHDALPARVFISLGSEEFDIAMPAARLTDLLVKREYRGLALESHVFQDENHVSVFPAAFSRGLRFLYAAEIPSLAGRDGTESEVPHERVEVTVGE